MEGDHSYSHIGRALCPLRDYVLLSHPLWDYTLLSGMISSSLPFAPLPLVLEGATVPSLHSVTFNWSYDVVLCAIQSVNYEANGWVTDHVSDIWAKSSPDSGQALWALWPMGGAWLSTHLWEHYTTLDKEFLKNKAYPLLEGCTLFWLDWLIEGHNGLLETNPSTSLEHMFIAPEHMFLTPDKRFDSVSYSTTMDISIIKQVFSSIVSAAEVKLIFCSNLCLLSTILV
ncbi:hypothetical protein PIB30_023854 [Stylosanthes scabra]|uniref:Glycosyl hydrolase family 95 catalytic domain-containing protein n=1 Tax=Stylosanthes scabra TaxID=79078 RepID=A0ABU6R9U6_9FABA|nr:hypothetical protein [Stylosanthes scabra]